MFRITFLFAFLLLALGSNVQAGMSGEKDIFLEATDGNLLRIGTAVFKDRGAETGIEVRLDNSAFDVNFISMRNFNCLGNTGARICHLPFDYPIRNEISDDDLRDLEYQLLFVFIPKGAPAFNAYNGLYYKLEADGSGGLLGQLMEVDLNSLSSPPKVDFARVIPEFDMIKASDSKTKYTRMRIC